MLEIAFSQDDITLATTRDEDLLIGYEAAYSCDGGPCDAPVEDPGPHWHLTFRAPNCQTYYVLFVGAEPRG